MPVARRSRVMLFLQAGLALAGMASASAASARQVAPDCPATMAAAQAMLQRQGRLPGSPAGYPQRYRPDGLRVLGLEPTALYVAHVPGVIFSFTYELPAQFQVSVRRAFESAYPSAGRYTLSRVSMGQTSWRVEGCCSNGPQPQHPVGSLLEVDLRSSYGNEGAYSLACVYYGRRRS